MRRVLWWVVLAVIAASLLALAHALPLGQAIDRATSEVRGLGAAAPVAYALLYVVAGLLFVPGSALTLGAGALFGPWVGLAVVSIASTATAALAFLIARHLARDRVARLAEGRPRFAAVDRAIAEGGWRVVALLRLSPALPFSLGNYLYGLTAVRFWPYVAASWVAMLPATFLYVQLGALGHAALTGGEGGGPARWVLLAAGIVATAVATVLVTRRARRALADTAVTDDPERPSRRETGPSARSLRRLLVLALILAALATLAQAQRATLQGLLGPPAAAMEERWSGEGTASFDHSALDALLARHVRDRQVAYADLAGQVDLLDAYLASLARAPFDELSRDDKLALLINAYNAFTLRLIIDHWPLGSIQDIPAGERWQARRWTLSGRLVSLDELEHEWVRGHFAEPRIHFALVCAARGCPPLRTEAYVGSRLEEQLADQARIVHSDPIWLRLDGDTLRLTRLYDWYASDFEALHGSVLESVARYSPEVRRLVRDGRTPGIEFLDYDWSLNGSVRSP